LRLCDLCVIRCALEAATPARVVVYSESRHGYLADAAPFVSGGTQNTTWSILAMCWRTISSKTG
jgi:hypothetical protein